MIKNWVSYLSDTIQHHALVVSRLVGSCVGVLAHLHVHLHVVPPSFLHLREVLLRVRQLLHNIGVEAVGGEIMSDAETPCGLLVKGGCLGDPLDQGQDFLDF